jgi:hypothetical protein
MNDHPMKLPEEAVREGVVNPPTRLFILLIGTWIIGSLHPLPETLYNLAAGPQTNGDWTWVHNPRYVDFNLLPILGTFDSLSLLVSAPISIWCVVMSVYDHHSWKKVTLLSGLTTLSMLSIDERVGASDIFGASALQLIFVGIFVYLIKPLRKD